MTTHQTTIQNPGSIRFGSAKIEIYDTATTSWRNLGAVKSLTMSVDAEEGKKFEPDNAPPIEQDPIINSWDVTFELQEAWDATVLKLLRGNVDTYTAATNSTVIGVEAGSGQRPEFRMRITNTTAGSSPVVIELGKCKCTSNLDITFAADSASDTALALPVTIKSYLQTSGGFGTITIPTVNNTYTISPASPDITVSGEQALTIPPTPGTAVFGSLDVSIATVDSSGVITGVSAGYVQIVATLDGVPYYVPVTVTEE